MQSRKGVYSIAGWSGGQSRRGTGTAQLSRDRFITFWNGTARITGTPWSLLWTYCQIDIGCCRCKNAGGFGSAAAARQGHVSAGGKL